MSEIHVQVLRAKIRGLQAEGTTIQRKIARSEGAEKHSLRTRKNALGHHTRYHLLAYAFFRGVPYKRVEQRTRAEIHTKLLLDIVSAHQSLTKVTELKDGRSYTRWVPWTTEMLEVWLKAANEGVV